MSRKPELFSSARQLAARAVGESVPPAGSAAEARLKAAATLELARALHHLKRTRSGRYILSLPLTTKVKGISMQHTDVPSELSESSDGVSDDGAIDQQIIGACACDAVGSGLRQHLQMHNGVAGGLQHISVAGGLQHISVAGLGDIAVGGLGDLTIAGFPGYLFTQKNLSNPTIRRRLAASIKAMTPKLRRRVMARLKSAALAQGARVGAVHNVYPTVGSGGWSGITVAGRSRGGCPYANVVGALTP
jgi:hypothetical protein